MDTVQQIKDKLSIVDVVSQYVKLERAGGALRARCPFHSERTPSFFVSPERGTYHCFGCNVGGDIFSFVEQIEGLDFKGALKILAEKAGVPLVYEKKGERDSRGRLFELLETATIFYTSHLNDSAREYLHKRGINDETVKSFRVGLAGEAWSAASEYLRSKGFSEKEILDTGLAKRGERGLYDRFRSRIIFPIADSAGRIVGFSGRIFLHGKEGTAQAEKSDIEPPKYLNSPETELFHKSRILYAYDRAKQAMRKNSCAILVEGQLDLLASHQAGWGNTVAVSGTAFTPEHAALISRMTENLVIALDADEAGIKAAGRAARAALRGGLNVKVARLPEGKDPADLILESGKDAWTTAIRESKDIIAFLLDVLYKHMQGGKSAIERDRFRKAVETIVLPFLADVQSPIAREQYVREIAGRLAVSEKAILDALANVPRDSSLDSPISDVPKPVFAERYGRAKQAFSLLLWQESCAKPQLDVAPYIKEFESAIGTDAYKILRSLPEKEQETLRFSAENLYGKSSGVGREAKTLLDTLLRDRLIGELAIASASLKRAEAEGRESAIEEMMRECKLLTSQIAQLPR
ncbi:MAG: DNA primase [bacterium]|nr:DNA primase [bacterium]